MTDLSNTHVFINDNDTDENIIQYLLENIDDVRDKLSDSSSNDSLSDSLPTAHEATFLLEDEETHVIYVKKRKYVRKQDLKRGPKFRPIIFPHIVKSDIRRKYMLMYENVINSYDYELICSFFYQFTKGDVSLEKRMITDSGDVKTTLLVAGVKKVTELFLVTLQIAPDKITRVSDIQVKQSSRDIERTEISCKFLSENTKCYHIHPYMLLQMLQNAAVEEENQSCEALVRRKRKNSDNVNDQSFHQKLFDPISGNFIRSRFSRCETPFSYVVSGGLSFIVNEQKLIERMILYRFRKDV